MQTLNFLIIVLTAPFSFSHQKQHLNSFLYMRKRNLFSKLDTFCTKSRTGYTSESESVVTYTNASGCIS